jgi:hypothetical protein
MLDGRGLDWWGHTLNRRVWPTPDMMTIGLVHMTDQNAQIIGGLRDLSKTTQILIQALTDGDDDKAHEAVTVLLTQGLHYFGAESVLMQQFFPVFDRIKQLVDAMDLPGALRQTHLFERQLVEITELVRSG